MKDVIKKALDEFIIESVQINLQSDAARGALAQFIYDKIKKVEFKKENENE